jgi:hypothetical protein
MTDLNTLQHDLNTATSKLNELERVAYGGGAATTSTTTLDNDTKHLMSYDLMNMLTGSGPSPRFSTKDTKAREYEQYKIQQQIQDEKEFPKFHAASGSIYTDEERIEQSKIDKTYRLMELMSMR